jgi:hypothetical protein
MLLDENYTIDFGVFNVTNPAPVTANEIVGAMLEVGLEEAKKKDWKFVTEIGDIPIVAKRSNCALNTMKIVEMGLALPSTEESLLRTLRLYKQFSETGTIIEQPVTTDNVQIDTKGGDCIIDI